MNVCVNVKPLNVCMYFCTKICDAIKNYVHHGKNHLRQEVKDAYIFLNYFVNNNMTIRPIIFYGAILIRVTVTIDPTGKPIILVY